ncbi:MAG: hypothetical protein K6348_03140 [Deferribacterales bacterium]
MEGVSLEKIGGNGINIYGNISSIDDYAKIRDFIKDVIDSGNNIITIKILDSKTVTSSLLGYFMKLVNHDKIKITLEVVSQELYNSLSAMHLVDIFNIKKI